MSGGTSEVLQEYLVKLGYQTDAISLRKFENGLGKTSKRILGIGMAVAGVAAAIEASTVAFAYSMRKMYFESSLAGSTVKNMKAMAYAGEQVGISADAMKSSIHNFAQAIRLNPGLKGLVESFGIETAGKQMDEIMHEFIGKTRKMPEFIGAQYAGMFGMDPDTYHQYITGFDKINEKRAESLRIQKEMGIDLDKQEKIVRQYTETLDRLGIRYDAFVNSVLAKSLPAFQTMSTWLDHILEGWTRLINQDVGKGSNWEEIQKKGFLNWLGDETGIASKMQAARKKSEETHSKVTGKPSNSQTGKIKKAEQPNAPVTATPPTQSSAPVNTAQPKMPVAQPLFKTLESQYKLPSGLLDSVWKVESNRGDPKFMQSKAGAKGHFQFMDATAKQYGLTDPNDLKQSATAAAKMYAQLLKKYKGNVEHALAAYNWGEGNMDSYLKTGKGARGQDIPSETLDYVVKNTKNIALGTSSGASNNVVISPQTTIHINGSNNPTKTANEVASAQMKVTGDIVRNTRGIMQ